VTNLKYFRLFCQTHAQRQPEIGHEPRDQFDVLRMAWFKRHLSGTSVV